MLLPNPQLISQHGRWQVDWSYRYRWTSRPDTPKISTRFDVFARTVSKNTYHVIGLGPWRWSNQAALEIGFEPPFAAFRAELAERQARVTAREARLAQQQEAWRCSRLRIEESNKVRELAFVERARSLLKNPRKLAGVGVVYFVKCGDFLKIGYAINFPLRLSVLQVGNPYELEPLYLIPGKPSLESSFHAMFSQHRAVHGEWFKIEGTLRDFLRELATAGVPKATDIFKFRGAALARERLVPCASLGCPLKVPRYQWACKEHRLDIYRQLGTTD
jgi:T5orf172 domain